MADQLTIWDLIEPESDNLENMTSADMAKAVSKLTGIMFKPSGWDDEHEAFIGKLKLTIHKSHYSCDTVHNKEGDAFVSCGWDLRTSGCGSPIDSIEGAAEFFRKAIERHT